VVTNSGEALHAGANKPLNTPEMIWIEEDTSGLPQAVNGKYRQVIISIDDKWRLDDEWWRTETISRLYYAVRLASGQKLEIYKDLITGRWYRQSY
jgi:hypothetical protein